MNMEINIEKSKAMTISTKETTDNKRKIVAKKNKRDHKKKLNKKRDSNIKIKYKTDRISHRRKGIELVRSYT
jgi:hypothetical protein